MDALASMFRDKSFDYNDFGGTIVYRDEGHMETLRTCFSRDALNSISRLVESNCFELEIIKQSNSFPYESKVSHSVKSAAKYKRKLGIIHSDYLSELKLVVTRL